MSKIQLNINNDPLPVDLEELKKLRRELHMHPEISGEEKETAARIVEFVKNFSPDHIITNLGGHGVAVVFKGKKSGPTVMLRSELDALPINEINTFNYKSNYKSKSHTCGHDGHSTILCGVAQFLSNNRPAKGKVILLFQPAEETGNGARKLLEDDHFTALKPDYIFGLHNLPGFEKNSIVFKEGVFAAASRGMIIDLTGKSSHAAEPENGINPSLAVAEILKEISALSSTLRNEKDFALITPIHVKIGEKAFGTSPGDAVIMLTLRSFEDNVMQRIIESVNHIVTGVASEHGIRFETGFTEVFPATINEKPLFDAVVKSAMNNNFQIHVIDTPFKWSEDFGYYKSIAQTAFFGIGSGREHPALHNPDYDFPDEITETGIKMFRSIINTFCE